MRRTAMWVEQQRLRPEVVAAHGHHPITDESRTVATPVVATVAVAVLARLAAEWIPARATPLLRVRGAVWMLGWLPWALRALAWPTGGRATEFPGRGRDLAGGQPAAARSPAPP